ncbi:LLM class flavin-dependent oxidoreductase [Streptomyces sp. NPDC085932]|uniref:LLM class flavin-dependent oxidoreductase n=1 Tax=Streptomyces sp. NPDC085932 TaxID=3365741 RepID=UPI0037D19067
MPDYGHDLLFGSFVTPTATDVSHALNLAVASEAAGLDLVTFQDHPYQPQFLDTWTLIAFAAARTRRITLAPNVLNTPLRPAPVTARAAASLALLSEGRLAMGLGAGASPNGILSMGGPKLTPAQKVKALQETITILRGLWADDDEPLTLHGAHHRVLEARPGPGAKHDIPIWLGAYKPRMLSLTGSHADGWLPSAGFLPPSEMRPSHEIIDAAAAAADRPPQAIRRLLNVRVGRFPGALVGAPGHWAHQLLPLVMEHGFSAFILASDNPDELKAFAQETAPALREAVAAERSEGYVAAAGGSLAANAGLATRVKAGNKAAWQDKMNTGERGMLPEQLSAIAVWPDDRHYEAVRHTYAYRGSPNVVLRARDERDVAQAVAYARAQSLPLAVRSGGHGISGKSTNNAGVVVDLGGMKRISLLDREAQLVRVEPGARWGDVARQLAPYGLAISSGDTGDVGVGGLATAGGIGFLARLHGLTIDHLQAAELILADGTFVRTDAENHPDLFWAVRGAGANMGVVTAFEFRAQTIGPIIATEAAHDASDTAGFVTQWGAALEQAPRELTSFLTLMPTRGGVMARSLSVYADDNVEASEAVLAPLLQAGPLLGKRSHRIAYADLIPTSGHAHSGGHPLSEVRSGLLEHLTESFARDFGAALASGDIPMAQFRAVGGAVNDTASDATAYAHRSQNFSLLAGSPRSRRRRLDQHWSRLQPHLTGLYISFETRLGEQQLQNAFPGSTLEKLRRIKAEYDPQNVFNTNFPIPPI